MSTIALPSWLKAQSIVPPTVLRSTAASIGRYSGYTDIGDLMSGDVWGMSISVVPMARSDSRRMEAFVNQLVGGLNLLSCHHLGSPLPLGTLRGAPTLGATMAQGSQTIQVTGALSGGNLVAGGSFENDSNADGLADGVAAYANGSTGVVSRTWSGAAFHGGRNQQVTAASLGTTSADQAGISVPLGGLSGAAGGPASASIYALTAAIGSPKVRLRVEFSNGSSVIGSFDTGDQPGNSGAHQRYSVSGTIPVGSVSAIIYAWISSRTGGAGLAQVNFDALQFELSAAPTPFSGGATVLQGDMLGMGSSIFQSASDVEIDGSGPIPVVNKARSAIAAGTPIVWSLPAALWRLNGTPQMMITPDGLQGLQLDLIEKAFA